MNSLCRPCHEKVKILKNFIVVVLLNNWNQSEKIVLRLKKKYKYIKFIIQNLI
jgi:hypothetical protein